MREGRATFDISQGSRRPREILAERSRRARLFPHMSEPEWLILLDLYAFADRRVSITSACLASYAPPTTALRHIKLLVDAGLARREPDETDGRKVYLRLTDEARERLGEYFSERVIARAA